MVRERLEVIKGVGQTAGARLAGICRKQLVCVSLDLEARNAKKVNISE